MCRWKAEAARSATRLVQVSETVTLQARLATRWWPRLVVLQKALGKAVHLGFFAGFGVCVHVCVETLKYEGGPLTVGNLFQKDAG